MATKVKVRQVSMVQATARNWQRQLAAWAPPHDYILSLFQTHTPTPYAQAPEDIARWYLAIYDHGLTRQLNTEADCAAERIALEGRYVAAGCPDAFTKGADW